MPSWQETTASRSPCAVTQPARAWPIVSPRSGSVDGPFAYESVMRNLLPGVSRRAGRRATSARVRGVKIADLRATPVNIPLKAPYRFAYGSIASLTKTVLEVVTDEGVVGLGEIAAGDCTAAAVAFRERLLGLDILDLNEAEARCVPTARYSPWDDALAHRRVFGGIELALWDARGKAEGRSLTTLLGGAVRDRVGLTEYFSLRLPGPSEPGEATAVEVARYCARMIEQHDAD